MGDTPTVKHELSLGFKARKLRVSRMLTRQELARIAGVSPEDVDLLEHNRPLQLQAKLNLLKALGAGTGKSK